MVGRRSVWSDDRLIEIAKNFVACTDEVWRLQNEDDPDCVFFRSIAQKGHYPGPKTRSKQGIYVCTADGTFLSSINSTSPDAVLKTLQKGLDEYRKLPKKERTAFDKAKIKSDFRWEDVAPVDGLSLAVYSRDLPEDLNPQGKRPRRWNRDSAWYRQSEIKAVMPKGLAVGDRFTLPDLLSRRLLRMNFVDTVRGQTDPFNGGEIKADIECVVTAAAKDRIEFSIKGQTEGDSTSTGFKRTPRGVVTKVNGSATYVYTKSKFEAFDLVAVGYRWGRTRHNGRSRGPEFNPLGFVVSIAPEDEPIVVPGLMYGYDDSWREPIEDSE